MTAQTLLITRYIVSGGFALIVIFGLFWVMQHLIDTADRQLDEDDPGRMLEIVRVPPEEEVIRDEPLPPKPADPEEPPPEPLPPSMDDITPGTTPVQVSPPTVGTEINFQGTLSQFSEGEYLPLAIVQPVYPRRAIARNIEGYVIVELTVTETGATRDIRVLEAVPPGMFDKAALAAAARFKYKPRVIDGQPVEVPGVPYKLTFELEE